MKTILSLIILFSLALSLAGCDSGVATGIVSNCANARCTITYRSIEGGPVSENVNLSYTSIFYNPQQVQVTSTVTVGSGMVRFMVRDGNNQETSLEATPGHPGMLKGSAFVWQAKPKHFSVYIEAPNGKAMDVKVELQYQ